MDRSNIVSSSNFFRSFIFIAALCSGGMLVAPTFADEAVDWVEQMPRDSAYLYMAAEVDVGTDMQAATGQAEQLVKQEFERLFAFSYEPQDSQTSLERALRREVVSKLPAMTLPEVEFVSNEVNEEKSKLYVLGRVSKQTMLQMTEKRMAEIERHLSDYRHVGEDGERIIQLRVILPALPEVEEYKALRVVAAKLGASVKPKQTPIALLLDRKITILFNEFLVMLDDRIPEAVEYEADFAEALRKKGLQISAKQPDLVLKYIIERTGEYQEDQPLGLSAKIDMLDPRQVAYASYEGAIELENTLTPEIERKALDLFADDVFKALTVRLLETTYQEKS